MGGVSKMLCNSIMSEPLPAVRLDLHQLALTLSNNQNYSLSWALQLSPLYISSHPGPWQRTLLCPRTHSSTWNPLWGQSRICLGQRGSINSPVSPLRLPSQSPGWNTKRQRDTTDKNMHALLCVHTSQSHAGHRVQGAFRQEWYYTMCCVLIMPLVFPVLVGHLSENEEWHHSAWLRSSTEGRSHPVSNDEHCRTLVQTSMNFHDGIETITSVTVWLPLWFVEAGLWCKNTCSSV